nr:hypothetical protein [Tanacetum cinerariifolium]
QQLEARRGAGAHDPGHRRCWLDAALMGAACHAVADRGGRQHPVRQSEPHTGRKHSGDRRQSTAQRRAVCVHVDQRSARSGRADLSRLAP